MPTRYNQSTFAHELGHSLGAEHDEKTDNFEEVLSKIVFEIYFYHVHSTDNVTRPRICKIKDFV